MEVNKVLMSKKYTQEEFYKEGCKNIYKFDDASETAESVISKLHEVYKLENALFDAGKSFDIELHMKELPFEVRVAVLRDALTQKDLLDATIVINVFNFIKSFNTFCDDFFTNDIILVNSIVEYLDLKTELALELKETTDTLLSYVFSVIKSVGVTEFTNDNQPEMIPLFYQRLLMASDFVSISNMLKKTSSVDHSKLILVANASTFLLSLCNKYSIANFLEIETGAK